MMTKNMTEPFLESSLMEEVCPYLHILALKKMFCPFSPVQLQPAASPVSRMDLNPVEKGEDRVGAAATTFTHDTLPQ